jgi:ARD/ARD' family
MNHTTALLAAAQHALVPPQEHMHTDEEIRFLLDGSGAPPCPVLLTNAHQRISHRPYLDAVACIRPCALTAGYFDVRDFDERWVRIACKKGTMIVLPEGAPSAVPALALRAHRLHSSTGALVPASVHHGLSCVRRSWIATLCHCPARHLPPLHAGQQQLRQGDAPVRGRARVDAPEPAPGAAAPSCTHSSMKFHRLHSV